MYTTLAVERVRQTIGTAVTVIHTPSRRLTMDSRELAQFIEARDGISKPWLLVLLRLKKLEERKDTTPPELYMEELQALHKELMGLGEWWVGNEDELFNP